MTSDKESREEYERVLETSPLEVREKVERLVKADPSGRNIGAAYGFFYCTAPERELEAYLPKAREDASTPNNLELMLGEGINPEQFNFDPELKELAYQAKNMGNNYTMTAYLPYATNEKTAHELGDIQNALYQSPLQEKFHKYGGKFWGGIVYREGTEYQFLD